MLALKVYRSYKLQHIIIIIYLYLYLFIFIYYSLFRQTINVGRPEPYFRQAALFRAFLYTLRARFKGVV